ncbi:MAG: glycosyltransferase [Ginsengibacter sp.]
MIDVFYRVKALHESGVKIHLHCFEYGRGEQSVLNKYCFEVNYYKRSTGWKGFSLRLPYIVNSRVNKKLSHNLLKDEHPVLLEGIHCTYYLFTDELKNKKVFVRLHNLEFEYYHQLAKNQSSFFKKVYYRNESNLLKKYEKVIAGKTTLLAITQKDVERYKTIFAATDINYLPVFLPYSSVSCREGSGNYCLYHGNLSIAENEKAAVWLCEIFKGLNIPLIIAGKNPSNQLMNTAQQNKNISLISNPSEGKMNELINDAQINILPSFNSSGIKIKLLNALFIGRHCIVNDATVSETGLESLCHLAETEEEFKDAIKQLFDEPFAANEIEQRNQLLKKEFNNKTNSELLMQWIY